VVNPSRSSCGVVPWLQRGPFPVSTVVAMRQRQRLAVRDARFEGNEAQEPFIKDRRAASRPQQRRPQAGASGSEGEILVPGGLSRPSGRQSGPYEEAPRMRRGEQVVFSLTNHVRRQARDIPSRARRENNFLHRLVRAASSGGATQNAKPRCSAAGACRNRHLPGDDYDGPANPSGAQKLRILTGCAGCSGPRRCRPSLCRLRRRRGGR